MKNDKFNKKKKKKKWERTQSCSDSIYLTLFP